MLTEAQEKKIKTIPKKLQKLYMLAVSGQSRRAAIRVACLECVCWISPEVEKCTSKGCPLYPYRLPGRAIGYGGGVDAEKDGLQAGESIEEDEDIE